MYSWIEPPGSTTSRKSPEAKATLRVEALDRLHHADVALGDQLADRQAIAPVAHGDLGDQRRWLVTSSMGGVDVVMLRASAWPACTPARGSSIGNLRISCRYRDSPPSGN